MIYGRSLADRAASPGEGLRADFFQGPGQKLYPRRPAGLIVDDAKLALLPRQAAHCPDKDVSPVGIYPCRPEDQGAPVGGPYRLLSGELAAAVDAKRSGFVFLRVGRGFSSIEDIIGGKVDQQRTNAPAFFRKHTRSNSIDLHGEVRL